MKKILVPIDFSDVTKAVVEAAAEQARLCKGEICLLHVVAPEPDFVSYDPGPQTVRNDVARGIHHYHKELDDIDRDLQKQGLKVKALLVQGPTVEKIISQAKAFGAELIVIGTHGHGALYHLILGSVSEGVVRTAHCPVLLIHSRPAEAAE